MSMPYTSPAQVLKSLKTIAGFKRNFDCCVCTIFRVGSIRYPNTTHPNAGYHESNVVEVRKEEGSHCRTISHMLNNSRHLLVCKLIHECPSVLGHPLHGTHVFRAASCPPALLTTSKMLNAF